LCIAKSLSSFFGSPAKVEYPYQSSASISENPTHATPDHATPEHGTRTPFDTKKEAVSKKTAPLLSDCFISYRYVI